MGKDLEAGLGFRGTETPVQGAGGKRSKEAGCLEKAGKIDAREPAPAESRLW